MSHSKPSRPPANWRDIYPGPRHFLARITDPERHEAMKKAARKRRRLYLIIDRCKALGITK